MLPSLDLSYRALETVRVAMADLAWLPYPYRRRERGIATMIQLNMFRRHAKGVFLELVA